ncbi:MAG: PRC-barrel domain-containing protein [Saprospiraceae bacterium]
MQNYSSLALIGNELYDSRQRVIGKIKDIVGSLTSGLIEYVIVTDTCNEFSQPLSRLYAIPIHFFQFLAVEDTLIFLPKSTKITASVNVELLPDHYHDLSVLGVDAFLHVLQSKN